MTFTTRCLVCDVAWALGMSEQGFYDNFEPHEREQLIATYRSRQDRESVVGMFPIPQAKGRGG